MYIEAITCAAPPSAEVADSAAGAASLAPALVAPRCSPPFWKERHAPNGSLWALKPAQARRARQTSP